MPTILLIFGFRFFFYADEHLPIHVHVEKGDGSAKILLEPDIEVVESEGLKKNDLKKALTICKTFRDDFIAKWHEFHD